MKELSTISVALMIECAAVAFGVTPHDIRSRRRTRDVALARQAVYWLAKELTPMSLPEIGRCIGERDHTTVIDGLHALATRRAAEPDLSMQLDALRAAVAIAAERDVGKGMRDVDAVAVAERIMRNPLREATRISTLDVAAIAARLIALEDLAGATFQLLLHIDELQSGESPRRRAAALSDNCQTLIRTIAGALTALGYSPNHLESHDDQEDQGAAAGAAAANV
jgi:Bacterial dnaA protein helix-turn-helix